VNYCRHTPMVQDLPRPHTASKVAVPQWQLDDVAMLSSKKNCLLVRLLLPRPHGMAPRPSPAWRRHLLVRPPGDCGIQPMLACPRTIMEIAAGITEVAAAGTRRRAERRCPGTHAPRRPRQIASSSPAVAHRELAPSDHGERARDESHRRTLPAHPHTSTRSAKCKAKIDHISQVR